MKSKKRKTKKYKTKKYKTYKKRTAKLKRRARTRKYTMRKYRNKPNRNRRNSTFKRVKRGGTVLGPLLGIFGGAGAASGIYWALQPVDERVNRERQIAKRRTLPNQQIYFYDDNTENKGAPNAKINFNLVETVPKEPRGGVNILDNGGITVNELRELIKTIEFTPEKVESVVLDWDRTFSCTEGFGIPNNADLLNYVNKQINFNVDIYKNRSEFYSLKRHYELYKIYNHPNLQEKIKLGEEFNIGIDEGELIMYRGHYSEWKHNAVNSPKQLAQTYFLPYALRNRGDYDVNNMDSIERIRLLKELFAKAYAKGIYIFILTNNKFSSVFLKEIMDTVLDINFPLEHILRGGTSSTWTDDMTKYTVMTRPHYPSVDIYKILKNPQNRKRLMIPEYQYTIKYLLGRAKAFELKVNDQRVGQRQNNYSKYLLDNITRMPNYEEGALLRTIDKTSEVFEEKLNELKRQMMGIVDREARLEEASEIVKRINDQTPKEQRQQLGPEP